MIGIKNKAKLRKNIYNIFFWIYGICSFTFFIWTLFCIWNKFNLFVDNKYVASQILEVTNFYVYFTIAILVIGFVLNMFVFRGEITKIIDKEYYGKISLIQSILFIIGILFLLFSPMMFKGANLTFYNYKLKTLYTLGYCTLLTNAFFAFYLFSFINDISEDNSYSKAKPYVYRIENLKCSDIFNLIVKQIGEYSLKGEFLNSNYKVDYIVCNKDSEYVYAFINLKNISDEFLKLYNEDRLFDFVSYLYSKVLDKKKNVNIMYFICAEEYNDSFKDLIQLSIYQDEHFSVIHTMILLKSRDLYIGGVRDDKKINVQNYVSLKEEIVRVLYDIIEKHK